MKKLLVTASACLIIFTAFAGKTPTLKDAVMGQNLELTQKALTDGADPNEQWSSAPALYWAAIQGRIDVIKLLVEKGAKVDGTGLMGMTPLDGAIEHPKSPEEYVAENNKLNEKILKHFTEAEAREKGWYKETDITKFSTVVDRVKVLLELGADPNFLLGNMSVKEWTPFLTAVDKGMMDVVKVMLDSKKVDIEFRFHQWAEGVVSFVSYVDVGKYEKGDRANAQKWALVPKFDTPLLYAVDKKNLELVKMLVEAGAQINNGKKIEYGKSDATTSTHYWEYWSPLDVATKAKSVNQEIVDYLKLKGAIKYQD